MEVARCPMRLQLTRTLSASTDQPREKVKPAPRKIVTRTHLGRVKWVVLNREIIRGPLVCEAVSYCLFGNSFGNSWVNDLTKGLDTSFAVRAATNNEFCRVCSLEVPDFHQQAGGDFAFRDGQGLSIALRGREQRT